MPHFWVALAIQSAPPCDDADCPLSAETKMTPSYSAAHHHRYPIFGVFLADDDDAGDAEND